MTLERLQRILGTCREVSAIAPDPRRSEQAVGPNGQGHDMRERCHDALWILLSALVSADTISANGVSAVAPARPIRT